MKNYFIVSLCKNGILGGGIIVDADKITYKTGKLTVPDKLRNLELKYEDMESVTRKRILCFSTFSFQMKNKETYKFLVFTPKRFMSVIDSMRQNQGEEE